MRPIRNSVTAYSPARKFVHWAVLILCIAQFPTGWAIANSHLGHVGLTQSIWSIFVHRSHALVGAAVVILVVAGVTLRLWQGAVAPTKQVTRSWLRYAATATHLVIPVLLLSLAGTGFIAMYLSRTAAPIHDLLVYFGVALIGLHVCGALWHQFVFRDGTLARMLPRVNIRSLLG